MHVNSLLLSIFIKASFETVTARIKNINHTDIDNSLPRSSAFVFGGRLTKKNNYPWHASFFTLTSCKNYFCGGSLISKDWVLSAGHCFHKNSCSRSRNPNTCENDFRERFGVSEVLKFRVKFGIVERCKPSNEVEGKKWKEYKQVREIKELVFHPDILLGKDLFVNDLTMVKLNESVKITTTVKPIQMTALSVKDKKTLNTLNSLIRHTLNKRNQHFSEKSHSSHVIYVRNRVQSVMEKSLWIMGFGNTLEEGRELAEQLKEAQTKYIPKKECKNKLGSSKIPAKTFCTSFDIENKNGIWGKSSFGDSGGSLVYNTNHMDDDNYSEIF